MVLELSSNGSVVTSDDPPVVWGTLAPEFLEQVSFYLTFRGSRLSGMSETSKNLSTLFTTILFWRISSSSHKVVPG